MSSLRGSQSGFSVIELIIVLTIATLMFQSFALTFSAIQNINKRAYDITLANGAAYTKLQSYESLRFDNALLQTTAIGAVEEKEDFSATLSDHLAPPRVGKVYVNSVTSTLKQVSIVVEFGGTDRKQTIRYTTLIQKDGLGR